MRILATFRLGVLSVLLVSAPLASLVRADGYLVEAKRADDTYHQFSVANFRTFHEARIDVERLCKRDALRCYSLTPIYNSCAASAMAWAGRIGWRIEVGSGTDIAAAKSKALERCRRWFGRDPTTPCRTTIEVCDHRPSAEDAIEPLINAPEQVHVGALNERAVADVLAEAFGKSTGVESILESRRNEAEQALLNAEAQRQREAIEAQQRNEAEAAQRAEEAAAPIFTAIKKALPKLLTFLLPFFFVFYGFAVRNGQPKQPPRVGWVGTAVSLFSLGILVSLAAEFALGIHVWRSSLMTFEGTVGTTLFFTLVWFLTRRFRKGRRFVEYLAEPFLLLFDFGAFIRGTFFLFSRHPVEPVVRSAIAQDKPINLKAFLSGLRTKKPFDPTLAPSQLRSKSTGRHAQNLADLLRTSNFKTEQQIRAEAEKAKAYAEATAAEIELAKEVERQARLKAALDDSKKRTRDLKGQRKHWWSR